MPQRKLLRFPPKIAKLKCRKRNVPKSQKSFWYSFLPALIYMSVSYILEIFKENLCIVNFLSCWGFCNKYF